VPDSIAMQTIVSTSLPTIVADLKGSQNQYAWVGVAYLLTQTACQPVYGKLADIFGRKVRAPIGPKLLFYSIHSLRRSLQYVLYTSTIVFLVGSALCGAAQVRTLFLQGSLPYVPHA
jgi:MFS family permease